MQAEEPKPKRQRLGRVAVWLGAVLLGIAALQSISVTDTEPTGSVDQAADESEMRTIKVKIVDLHPVDPNRPAVERGVFDLNPDESTSIAARDLPTETPLVLNLLLPAALPSADALPARIISVDGSRELKLPDALVAADRDRVRVQIESGWLSPGRYRIEIETAERSQPTLRRYPLEVR
jgi:hypothetical protein